MKKLLIFLSALAAYGTDCTISDTVRTPFGGYFAGRIVVALNSPGSAQPLYSGFQTLTGWQTTIEVPSTANGVVAFTLVCTDTITPSGTSYSARYQPTSGSGWAETWSPATGTTTIRAMRATTVPTPTTTFQASQLALSAGSMVYGSSAGVGTALAAGSNGQVLALSGGYPAWTTNISGNAGTATALAANGTNCAAGTFPLGVDASGNSESCTALPTTITGTANQITASASTGAVTLSLPTTLAGLASVTSTSFTGALTGNASTATALASTVASGRLWIGQGTGVPTSDAGLTLTTPSTKVLTLTHSNGSQIFVTDTSAGTTTYKIETGGGYVTNGTTTAHPFILAANNTEALRIFSSTRNVAIGTTTDLGYGLHAANRGTNGNLLVFDPTATTGTTKAVVRAGAGQSGNIFEVQNAAGAALASIASTGFVSTPQVYLTGDWLNLTSTTADMASGYLLRFSSTAAQGGTKDLSLSRASAGVLQVGDGGANANGYLTAARIGVGTASPGAFIDIAASSATAGLRVINGSLNQNPQVRVEGYATVKMQSMNPASDPRASIGTESNNTLEFIVNNSGVARFAATSGNLLIGTTTDGNYKLDVANSGSSGTLRVYDQTATTGNTKEVIRAGAGQSTNLTEWQNNAGTVVTYLTSGGNISTDATANFGTDVYFKNGGATQPNKLVASGPNSWLRLGQSVVIAWDNNTNALGGSMDSGLKRAAAGYVAVTDGSTGLGKIVVSQSTPAASTDACTAGAIWADATYAYFCTATGAIKRVTLNAF